MIEKPQENARKRRKKRIRRLITLLIVLAVLGLGGWYLYDSFTQEYVPTYDSYTATIGSINNSLSFSGSLQLVDSQNCVSTGSATVRTVYVSEGDKVKKGDKLLRLSDGESFEADFDGTVNQVYVEKDEEVTANTTLAQVGDFNHLKVSIRVDEYDISSVQVGAACTVTATAAGKTYESTIASINYISASAGNVAYYTTTAYITVGDDDGVYPGMQVTITLPQESAENVVVLKSDALTFDRTNNAFVLKKNASGEMEQVAVETGVSNGNYVEIKSGVEDGETVYVETKSTGSSGLSSALSSLFGSQQVNEPTTSGHGNWSGTGSGSGRSGSGSGSSSGSGFGGGSMPSFPGN